MRETTKPPLAKLRLMRRHYGLMSAPEFVRFLMKALQNPAKVAGAKTKQANPFAGMCQTFYPSSFEFHACFAAVPRR
jgi:hypothetical protein